MAFSPRFYIRVVMSEDGRTPVRELMVDGVKVAEMNFAEAVDFAMQAVSSLRWEKSK